MQNHLSQKFIFADQTKKLNSSWKLALVLLGLGSFLPSSLPLVAERMQPLLSTKVMAQEAPPATNRMLGVIRIGVLSKEDKQDTIKEWQPTIDYLAKAVPGYTFELVVEDFEGMYKLAETNGVDFFITNPGMYVDFEASYGANRIATLKTLRLGKPYVKFGGVIFTKADRSDINNLQDLKNKNFMAVDPISLGGWQMTEGVLFDAGIENPEKFFNLTFGGTHEKV
ncbi:MAG: hypothetical protein RLZZ04_49, partial [Cyanobacteriota bacterium]